ncbi:adenosylcobinamide-phosphate synthase CbiB [Curvibacter sp. HBC61]|uniref:Cobalamin biosynthesis protein CobD n=1 Tax=Curvibacter cyanobacteriorum TaxID=3026422 RepID=A0ABT5MZX8_9BURK|nr:adenosylcobinamide-phosphate synthase CbiB [Curvibacter sp. HBC61]MDD0838821.1 adenosylcobinamide-phosphate synthase CbiB [Curvibacter sp. HBC61]
MLEWVSPGGAVPSWWLAAALAVALAVDHALGEPPVRWHPVVWMGHYLGWAGRWLAPQRGVGPSPEGRRDLRRGLAGAALWGAGAALTVAVAAGLQQALLSLGPLAAVLGLGLLLKPLLAWRMLRLEVQAVEAALGQSLDAGRQRLAWLVSRDVSALSASEVRESALESLSENLNDSVIAPLFWFAVAGLPGAALYRFANTADAMWGYPGWRRSASGEWRYWAWAGKWAARADDALSWVPARLTAGLLLGGRGALWRALPTQARQTPSPNSGWPMAALALRLSVRLAKPGVYTLNPGAPAPEAVHTERAIALAGRAVLLGGGLGMLLTWAVGRPW